MKNNFTFRKPKSVCKYDLKLKLIEEYSSVTIAAMKNNISVVNLVNCLKGRQKSAAGCIWKYKNLKTK